MLTFTQFTFLSQHKYKRETMIKLDQFIDTTELIETSMLVLSSYLRPL